MPSKRQLLADAIQLSGLGALLLRMPSWRGLVVLSYHRTGEGSRQDVCRSLFTPPAAFEDQMRLIARHFDVVDPRQVSAGLLNSSGRKVMVTIDDGYRDLYEIANPALQKHGVRAAVFLCTGFVDGHANAWWDEIAWILRHSAMSALPPGPWCQYPLPLTGEGLEHAIQRVMWRYWTLAETETTGFLGQLARVTGAGRRPPSPSDWITWDMARELMASGHTIGAHTVTHPVLARMALARQRAEVMGSLERIETELGERPRWFAYPVGTKSAFDRRARELMSDAGIELAFSNYGGYVTQRSFAPLDVRRVSSERLSKPNVFSGTLALPQVFARP